MNDGFKFGKKIGAEKLELCIRSHNPEAAKLIDDYFEEKNQKSDQ